MSFTSWLRNIRSALAPSRGQRNHRRRGSLRAATHRPRLELLEDRCTPSTYAVMDLGTLGGTYSEANAINASGEVAGSSTQTADGALHAFSWQDGVMTDLGTLGGTVSHGYGINDAGQVVGPALPPGSGNYHAFLSSSGNMTDLGTLGAWDSVAHDINNSGQVVGWRGDYPTWLRGWIWQNGVMTDLDPLPGNPENSEAGGINDSGQVVGYSSHFDESFYDYVTMATLWTNGVPQYLGSLPDSPNSNAFGLNDSGQVVGWSGDSISNHACLWQNGTMQDLGTLAGSGESLAIAVNASAKVVGISGSRAFVWQNGVMSDLNGRLTAGSGWELAGAGSINDGGQIVGSGIVNGETHAFLLTPSSSLDSFVISGSPTATAGDAVTFTVTARSDSGTTLTDYTGTVTFSSSDWQAGLPVDYTFTAADQGVHTFTATLRTAGSQTLSVADTTYYGVAGTENVEVTPAAVSQLSVAGFPSVSPVGAAGDFSVTATDAYGNTATNYTGTVHLTSSDPLATFSAADVYNGAADFSATDNPNGAWQYGWAPSLGSAFQRDAVQRSIDGLDFWQGNPAGDVHGNPSVSHNGTGAPITLGETTLFQPGQLAFHPGPGGEYAVVRWTAPAAGVISVGATFTGLAFTVPTTTDVHVLHNGSVLFNGAVTAFGAGPSFNATRTILAGDTIDFAVGFGNGDYGFDTTGLDAVIRYADPAPITDYTFTAADAGRHTFSATFWTVGTQSITVTDLTNPSITGTQTGILVVPSITISDVTVTEGNTGTVNATFTVSLSAASGQAVTVNYATANGTATAGSDYQAQSGTLTFAPGETTKTITVLVNGDTLYEPDESFFINLTSPTNAVIADGSGTGIIQNDDPIPPSLVISDVSVTEGNTGTVNATFTLSLSAAYAQPVTVHYETANGSATAGSDYMAMSGDVNFGIGETTKTITVPVNGDVLNEADETFLVNLSGAANAMIADGQGVATILNDDSVPALAISDVTVTEGNAGTVSATFTVSLSAASGQTVTVSYATADGTARAGSDYVAAAGSLTFAPGETSKTVTVLVNGDVLNEAKETFFVNLSNPTNATIADGQGVGSILNDDAVPTLTINDATVTEGNAGTVSATFTVNLSAASGQTVTVSYATANGTARAGSDYVAAAGNLTFAPGETSKTITVLVNGDRLGEANELGEAKENFFVNLSSPTNATFADGQGVGTIVDDEPRISISDVAKKEGNGKKTTLFVFTVTLSAAYDQAVTMSFQTVDGTAKTSDSDYVAKTGTLTFAPGETTKTITIEVKGDNKNEADEYFYLDLFGNSSNSLFTKNRGIGTILNDD
jgi:large repetitive protein